MDNENNNVSILHKVASALHVSIETFIVIVSVIFVVGISCTVLKEMFFSNPVKDIYMNWQDITYVSVYFDDDKHTEMVSITYQTVRGMPTGVTLERGEVSQSRACPTILTDSVTVPTMKGNTLMLPMHFDSVPGYVREYNSTMQEED